MNIKYCKLSILMFFILCLILSSNNSLNSQELTVSKEVIIDYKYQNVEHSEWTVMLYLDGDHDTEWGAWNAIHKIESIIDESTNITVIALYDRHPDYIDFDGNWTEARIYKLKNDLDYYTINSELEVNLGEINMGDPQTLRNFVNWSQTNYPAKSYILDLFNHGGGTRGICADKTEGDILSLNDVQQAMKGFHVDLTFTSACLMGMIEVAYEWSTFTDYLQCSEHVAYGSGFCYDTWVAALCDNEKILPYELANVMCEEYMNLDTWGLTQSVINCSNIQPLVGKISNCSDLLLNELPAGINRITDIRVEGMSIDNGVDLGHFFYLIKENFTDKPTIQQASQEVLEALEKTIIYNYYDNDYRANISGLRVYFPQDKSHNMAKNYFEHLNSENETIADRFYSIDLYLNSSWDEFLEQYLENAPKLEGKDLFIDKFLTEDNKINLNIDSREYQHFGIEIVEAGVYRFELYVGSGDINIMLYDSWDYQEFQFNSYFEVGWTDLDNSRDGNREYIQLWLEPSTYRIVFSALENNSKGNMVYQKEEITILKENEYRYHRYPTEVYENYITSTEIHYYFIKAYEHLDLIINTNSGLAVYFEIWNSRRTERIVSSEIGKGDTQIYKFYSENSTYLLEIGGIKGSGTVQLILNNHSSVSSNPGTSTSTTLITNKNTPILINAIIMPLILLFIQRRKKKD